MQSQVRDTEVLIVGAGPAGLTAAIALARAGVDTLVLERRHHPSRVPRATGISTSTMELMRSWALEAELREGDLEVELRPWVTESLAAAAAGQPSDAGFPTREQSALISPTAPAAIPQDHLEPVLERHLRSVETARVERGVEVTEIRHAGDGVVLTAREVDGGNERRIRARYLIGADGVRSTVRKKLGIPAARREELGGSLAVTFRAPLWDLLGEHRYVIYWLTGERPPVFVPAGQDRWVFATFWDPAHGAVENLSPSDVTPWIREAAGYEDLDVRVDRIALVPFGVDLAERFRDGSVFLVGDAAHRVTPRGATGLNTAIRSGYDLGWKLAWVLRGWAGEALLDSYEAERRPVAEHNVERSAQPSGSIRPVTAELRADLGGRIAHLWLPGEDGRVSTLDLLGDGLTLFTGPEAEPWETLAAASEAPVPVAVRTLDELTARALGIARRGALLVRPDGVPAGLWTDAERGAIGLPGAVGALTGEAGAVAALAA
jgi:2-polyprenyl-6-methoxyphenol hydroxylase-like FAD-dependent oxidoreductase